VVAWNDLDGWRETGRSILTPWGAGREGGAVSLHRRHS
jgi:hypothetical protein